MKVNTMYSTLCTLFVNANRSHKGINSYNHFLTFPISFAFLFFPLLALCVMALLPASAIALLLCLICITY